MKAGQVARQKALKPLSKRLQAPGNLSHFFWLAPCTWQV